MGFDEVNLWNDSYEAYFCYDCLDFSCKRRYEDKITCQWRKWKEAFEEGLESEDE